MWIYLRWFGTRVRVCSCVRERSVQEHSVFEERSVREHVFELSSRQGLEGYLQGLWPKSVFELCSNCVRDCVREEIPNLQLCSSVFEQSVFECSCVRVCSCVRSCVRKPFSTVSQKHVFGNASVRERVLENTCSSCVRPVCVRNHLSARVSCCSA